MFFLGLFHVLVLCAVTAFAVCVLGFVFAGATYALARKTGTRHRLTLALRRALPFSIWALVTTPFVLVWLEAERFSFPGFAFLPDGYVLLMIHSNDPAWLYGPTQNLPQNLWPQIADGVETIQCSDRYIAGAQDSHGLNFGRPGGRVDSYFLLARDTGKVARFSSLSEFEKASSAAGISLSLEPVLTIYFRYGPLNPANILWFALVPLLVAFGCLLVRWIGLMRGINRSDTTIASGPEA